MQYDRREISVLQSMHTESVKITMIKVVQPCNGSRKMKKKKLKNKQLAEKQSYKTSCRGTEWNVNR